MISLKHTAGDIFYFLHDDDGEEKPANLADVIGIGNDIYGSDYQSCTIIYGGDAEIADFVEVMKEKSSVNYCDMDIFIITVASIVPGKTFIYSNWDFNDFGELEVPKNLFYIFAGAQADDMDMTQYIDFFIIKNAFTKSLKFPDAKDVYEEYYEEAKDIHGDYGWDDIYIKHLSKMDTLTFMNDYIKTMYQWYPTSEGEALQKQLRIIERGIEIRDISKLKITSANLHFKYGKSDKQYNLKFNDSKGKGKSWIDTYYGKNAENHFESPYVTPEVAAAHITKTVVKQMKKGYQLISYI